MNILIVTPTFPPEYGGTATESWELFNRLTPKHKVSVVSFAQEIVLTEKKIKLVSTNAAMLLRQAKLFLSCLIYGKDCDVFYLVESGTVGLSGLLAAKLLGKKIVTKYIGDPVWDEKLRNRQTTKSLQDFLKSSRSLRNFRSQATKIVLNLADQVIVSDTFLQTILVGKQYIIPKVKIQVLTGPRELAGKVVTQKESPWDSYSEELVKIFSKLVDKL